MCQPHYGGRIGAVGWIPRNLTQRIVAQRGRFILSGYADQPWGSIQIASTYVWEHDVQQETVDPKKPRVFFVAVTPELKKEVIQAGSSGLLGVDPMSHFPDIVGFATACCARSKTRSTFPHSPTMIGSPNP
jgi:hypothetical protein